jgi:hypothetical protein
LKLLLPIPQIGIQLLNAGADACQLRLSQCPLLIERHRGVSQLL